MTKKVCDGYLDCYDYDDDALNLLYIPKRSFTGKKYKLTGIICDTTE